MTIVNTVWIATDFHGTPQGTFSNPHDGSTLDKFDALMRGFAPGTRIRLLDGIFETSGSANFNPGGFYVKDGWQIIGNGPERTTIKKVYFPPEAVGASHATLEVEMTAAGGVTVQDLCIDENWHDGLDPDYCTSAVHLCGDNCTIRNVWAKNGFGSRANGREAFTLISNSALVNGQWQNNTGAVIENCRVFDFKGDYGTAIALAGAPDGSASAGGYVRNNTVTGYPGTSAFALGGANVLFEGNTSSDCAVDYYGEMVDGAIIVGARMGPTTGFNVHLYPVMGGISNVVFEGCEIKVSTLGIAIAAIANGHHCSNITLRSNIFTGAGEAINANDVDGLTIENNAVVPGMISRLVNCPNAVVAGNTISGPPVGLEDT